MLYCDRCDRAWHMGCLEPPVRRKPKGDWFCSPCTEYKQALAEGRTEDTAETAPPPSPSTKSDSPEPPPPPPPKRRGRPPGVRSLAAAKSVPNVPGPSRVKPSRSAATLPDADVTGSSDVDVAPPRKRGPASSAKRAVATAKKPIPPSRSTRRDAIPEESSSDDARDEVDFLSSPKPASGPSRVNGRRAMPKAVPSKIVADQAPPASSSRTSPAPRSLRARPSSKRAFVELPTGAGRRGRLHSQTIEVEPNRRLLPTPPDTRSPPTPPAELPAGSDHEHEMLTPLPENERPVPSRLPSTLPEHLHHCLAEQKNAALGALRRLPIYSGEKDAEDQSPNLATKKDLSSLLNGTVEHGEGNSCLLIGPRGSGKTAVRLFFQHI